MNSTASLTAAHCANPDTVARLERGQPCNTVCAIAWKDMNRARFGHPFPYGAKCHMSPEREYFATPAAALARVVELNAHLSAPLSS